MWVIYWTSLVWGPNQKFILRTQGFTLNAFLLLDPEYDPGCQASTDLTSSPKTDWPSGSFQTYHRSYFLPCPYWILLGLGITPAFPYCSICPVRCLLSASPDGIPRCGPTTKHIQVLCPFKLASLHSNLTSIFWYHSLNSSWYGVPVVAQWLMNPTRNH